MVQRILSKQIVAACVLTAAQLSSVALAEVVESMENRFKIVSRATVAADSKTVYEQFLRAGEWWNLEHSWFGKDSSMSIEPKAGGCFCEINGDSEVEHMRVVFVQPNSEVRLAGALGPLQMMGLQGIMSWKFTENDQTTKIEQTYIVSGAIPETDANDGLKVLAPIVDRVQSEQLNRLAARFTREQQ